MHAGCSVYRRRPDGALTSTPGVLTNVHAMSSHGLPVLVLRGDAYGPGDLPGTVLVPDDLGHAAGWAEAAGWTVARSADEARQLLPEG
jgi:hypothetical protein